MIHLHGPRLCGPAQLGTPPQVVRSAISGGYQAANTVQIAVNAGDGVNLALYAFGVLNETHNPTGCGYDRDGSNSIYAPVAMTEIANIAYGGTGAGTAEQRARLVVYRLLDPPTSLSGGALVGLQGVSGSPNGKLAVVLVSGVDQGTPEETEVTATGTSDAPAIGPVSGALVLAAMGWCRWTSPNVADPVNTGAQTTLRADTVDAPFGQADPSLAVGAGPSHEWDIHESKSWGMVAIPINGTAGQDVLNGTSQKAARCDHQHHWYAADAPTADDDTTIGYRVGTRWVQLDDLTTPTEVVAVWVATDVSEGAAVWVAEPFHPEDHAARHEAGGADELTFENLATAETDTALVPHPDGTGGIAWGTDEGGGGGSGGGAYAETIGDGAATSIQVTHALATEDVIVQVWDVSGANPILLAHDHADFPTSITVDDADNITLVFGSAPATDEYRVVVSNGASSGGWTFVPTAGTTPLNFLTTTSPIGATALELTDLPASGVVAVQVIAYCSATTVANGNNFILFGYQADRSTLQAVPALQLYGPSATTNLYATGAAMIPTGSTNDRSITYQVGRVSGTVRYALSIVGYWIA